MRLADKIADSIIELIINNNLKAGDKLPNEYELAEELNVGRSTLREAVRSLHTQNILEVRQGSGTYVSKNIGISDDPLGFKFIKDTWRLTEDLFAVRYILEPEVAMLAAQNRTEDEFLYLEDLANQIEEAVKETTDLHFELDIKFHTALAKMSGNIAMVHLVPIINQSITLFNHYYTNEQSKVEMVDSHREIVESIRNKDSVEARYAMRRHISNIRKKLDSNSKLNTELKTELNIN